jgi:hypothetical protein
MAATTWKIRYEGQPTNPRFRTNKRRIAQIITDAKGAKEYAKQLERFQHVKILSIEGV